GGGVWRSVRGGREPAAARAVQPGGGQRRLARRAPLAGPAAAAGGDPARGRGPGRGRGNAAVDAEAVRGAARSASDGVAVPRRWRNTTPSLALRAGGVNPRGGPRG